MDPDVICKTSAATPSTAASDAFAATGDASDANAATLSAGQKRRTRRKSYAQYQGFDEFNRNAKG
jgi:hypothetical protein